MEKEISITYETLFELLRREKSRDELQTLSPAFYKDVVDYLAAKNQLMPKEFSPDSRRMLLQMENTSKIIRELYERREKKILFMALNKSRTGSSIIDTSSLLDEEKKLFDDLLVILESTRQGILCNLLNARLPDICPIKDDYASGVAQKAVQPEAEQPDPMKMVRLLESVPKLIGTELETYGPFEQDDVVKLPNEIANVLITKGRAEEVQ